jgi:hypothetical protein
MPIPIIASDMTITSTSIVSHVGMRFAGWVIACALRSHVMYRKSASGCERAHIFEQSLPPSPDSRVNSAHAGRRDATVRREKPRDDHGKAPPFVKSSARLQPRKKESRKSRRNGSRTACPRTSGSQSSPSRTRGCSPRSRNAQGMPGAGTKIRIIVPREASLAAE